MQKITPCLCFDHQAEAAVNFYATVFDDLKILSITRCGADEFGGPPGSVRTVSFELFGQTWLAVNAGMDFGFNESVSFIVSCDTQSEIDRYWDALGDGGKPRQCGWLKDRFGVRWQIMPAALGEMISDADPAKSNRVMQALLQMVKLDLAALQDAYDKP